MFVTVVVQIVAAIVFLTDYNSHLTAEFSSLLLKRTPRYKGRTARVICYHH